MDRWKIYKKCDPFRVKAPKTVEDLIEIVKIDEDGLFEMAGSVYTKTYRFTDINYENLSPADQLAALTLWCEWLNSMQSPFEITIFNKNVSEEKRREEVYLKDVPEGMEPLADAYNMEIARRVQTSRKGIRQELYLTIRTEAKDFDAAASYFKSLEYAMESAFGNFGSTLTALSASERLQVIYNCYNYGREDLFAFDFKRAVCSRVDFKEDICPSVMDLSDETCIRMNDFYCACMYLSKYPGQLSDRMISQIAALPVHMLLSVTVNPVADTDADYELERVYNRTQSYTKKQNKNRVNDMDFSTEISHTVTSAKAEVKQQMDEREQGNQHYFYAMVNLCIYAKTKEELLENVRLVRAQAKAPGNNVTADYCYFRQKEAFNTCMPLGLHQLANGRNFQTKALAAFYPFKVQELYEPDGFFYGSNYVSKNLVCASRKKRINPHGFIFGVTGSGKTTAATLEMLQVYMRTSDDIIVISPKNDYKEVTELCGGSYVDVSPVTDTVFNPFYFYDTGKRISVADEKSDLALSLVETCKREPLTAKERSIVARAVKEAYRSASGTEVTLPDVYNMLLSFTEPEAAAIRLYLELFVTGSMAMFAGKSTVTMDHRLTVFGLFNMGEGLRDLTMLVMLENIKERVIYNASIGKATWLYIDEFPEVLKTEYQRKYFKSLWMLLRSMGCIITGMTQNVSDVLSYYDTRALLENSEFLLIFKQNQAAKGELEEDIGLSGKQIDDVTKMARPGRGILRCGQSFVSVDMELAKGTMLYDIINTDFHELHQRR